MKKIIIFDVDRTLVDSYKAETESMREAFKIGTGKILTEEDVERFMSLSTSKFLNSFNLTDEEINIIYKEWDNKYDNYKVECFPKMKEVIKELNSKGYSIGIITARTSKEFHELDDELKDIIDNIKIVITSDLINKPKPNRDSIDYLCNKLKCNTEDIIYIGDSNIDKQFAINSNVKFIPACFENKELSNEENACYNSNDLLSIIDSM